MIIRILIVTIGKGNGGSAWYCVPAWGNELGIHSPLAITFVEYIVCASLPTWADDVVCMVGKCIRHMLVPPQVWVGTNYVRRGQVGPCSPHLW